MLNPSLTRALLAAVTFSMLACSGGGSGGDGGTGGGSVTPDQACNDAATSLCNKLQTCSSFLITVTYGDVTACIARTKLGCLATFSANGTGTTASTISACIAAETAMSCTDIFDGTQPAACDTRGTLVNGTACGDGAQCTSGYCNISTGNCGVCAARIAAGGACTGGGCEIGLVCGGSVCKTPGAAGDTCSLTAPCKTSLYCSASGSCATPVMNAGDACPAGAQCNQLNAIFCGAAQVCTTIPVAEAGSPCGLISGSYTACKGGSYCKLTTGGMGTCATDVADGASCSALGSQCLSGAKCGDGVCKLPSGTCT